MYMGWSHQLRHPLKVPASIPPRKKEILIHIRRNSYLDRKSNWFKKQTKTLLKIKIYTRKRKRLISRSCLVRLIFAMFYVSSSMRRLCTTKPSVISLVQTLRDLYPDCELHAWWFMTSTTNMSSVLSTYRGCIDHHWQGLSIAGGSWSVCNMWTGLWVYQSYKPSDV